MRSKSLPNDDCHANKGKGVQSKQSVEKVYPMRENGNVGLGCHVNQLGPSDLHKGLIRQPCFNLPLGLLDACVERSRVYIFT